MGIAIEYDKRTADAIRKADALPLDLTVDRGAKNSSSYINKGDIYYGNTYLVKIKKFLKNGLYLASIIKSDGTISDSTIVIGTLDMMIGEEYLVDSIVQVTEANVQYASYIGKTEKEKEK